MNTGLLRTCSARSFYESKVEPPQNAGRVIVCPLPRQNNSPPASDLNKVVAGCQRSGVPVYRGSARMSEIEFQGKLDLARVVERKARRTNSAKVCREEVRGAGQRSDPVAAESRSVKGRVVQNVEELAAELQTESFIQRNILEQ